MYLTYECYEWCICNYITRVYWGNQYILRPWQTRTHCCGHIVADTNVSPFARAGNICCGHKFCVRDTKKVSDFVQKHFVSATNVSQFVQHKKHHEQQCVRNNVPSFAGAFIRCFGVKYRCKFLRVLLYFGEPVRRVTQTRSKNIQRYYTAKHLIRILLSSYCSQ